MRTARGADTDILHRTALGLALFTVGYNILEGVASLVAGTRAGSIALTGFGLDSFVESLSGAVMIWRLGRVHDVTSADEEARERKALRLIGVSFFVFAGYVLYESAKKLFLGEISSPSLFGMGIAAASLVVMPVLYLRKLRVGRALGMRSLIADSKETLACVYLSASLFAGLGLNYVWGVWWADPAIGFLIVFFLVREGIESFSGEEEEDGEE